MESETVFIAVEITRIAGGIRQFDNLEHTLERKGFLTWAFSISALAQKYSAKVTAYT